MTGNALELRRLVAYRKVKTKWLRGDVMRVEYGNDVYISNKK
jgi:hypothetical protein